MATWADCSHFKASWHTVGSRVELHPATDAWMMGDRFGTVAKTGDKYVHVKMDVSGKTRKVLPANIGRLYD